MAQPPALLPTGSKFTDGHLRLLKVVDRDATGPIVESASVPDYIAALDAIDLNIELVGGYESWTGHLSKFYACMEAISSVRGQQVPGGYDMRLSEAQVDLLAYELLLFVGFDRQTFKYYSKPNMKINFRQQTVSVEPDFVLARKSGGFALCLVEESKVFDGAPAEPQVFAECLAIALQNYAMVSSSAQEVYAVRLRGTSLRFYRAQLSETYLRTLNDSDAPKDQALFERYPPNMAVSKGLDLLDTAQRRVALQVLYSMRHRMAPSPPGSSA